MARRDWHVGFTGAVKDTLLVGCSPCTQGCRISLDQDVLPCRAPPSQDDYNDLLDYASVVFPWSKEEIKDWFSSYKYGPTRSLGLEEGQENARISFYEIGAKVQSELSEDQVLELSTRTHTTQEIEAMFPEAHHDKKNTLVLHRSLWKIDRFLEPDRNKEGCLFWIDLETGRETQQIPENKHFLRIQSFGVFYQTARKPLKPALRTRGLESFFSTLTLGGLKSLLQKLIRFQGTCVSASCGTYETSDVLVDVMMLMAYNSGSFVPQLQQFEYGLPSWLKRMVVIAFEDAYVVGKEADTHLTPTM